LVLENFYKRGREADPPVREAFLATGRLALAKNDDALASRAFQEGIAAFPEDAGMWTGLAAAFLDGDRSKLVEYASHALSLNPHHATAHLLLAEHLIDGEQYDPAREHIDDVLATNPRHPEGLAFSAVLAELDNDRTLAESLRARALESWADNPAVDHIIGRKLSQKYRFAEGSRYQEAALALDPDFIPAQMQLAQDLLRLGREDEGWKLATAVHEADGYHVSAYNLVTLRDRLSNFTVLTSPHFRLRMAADEAPIYGERALALLEEARAALTAKYGLELPQPVTVEIYPNPKDFAVRTFGMPDNPGFLGVCFGPVVTINSPATRQANWESVLWHEFTHVVTLTMTHNRMPRWLSEGISVLEETLRDPSWGQRMSLDYRERILDGRMQPISGMSAAFLESKDGDDLQFAYFQSYLAVRHLVEHHGFEKLRALLQALGDGAAPNDAISATIAPIDELDAAYLAYATGAARSLGGGLDLRPVDDFVSRTLAQLNPNPNSFFDRLAEAKAAMESGDWAAARTHLEAITSTGFYLSGAENAYLMLAQVCNQLSDTAGERAALETVAENESAPLGAVTRLLELATLAGDRPAAIR
ncbi:MAG: peptidase MA family metallohydrolase, partial [Opitutaceae bacterium]